MAAHCRKISFTRAGENGLRPHLWMPSLTEMPAQSILAYPLSKAKFIMYDTWIMYISPLCSRLIRRRVAAHQVLFHPLSLSREVVHYPQAGWKYQPRLGISNVRGRELSIFTWREIRWLHGIVLRQFYQPTSPRRYHPVPSPFSCPHSIV